MAAREKGKGTLPQSIPDSPPAGTGRRRWLPWLVPAVVVLLTFLAFLPALDNGFVNWDDDGTLTRNPHFRGLGWTQIRWMFTTFHLGHYVPLTWLSYGLDYTLWGMDPRGYHLTSLLLHCANALLFFFISRRLLRLAAGDPGSPVLLDLSSGLAALAFSIHPLRVQSVAWATERRDVLSGLFVLLSLTLYLTAREAPDGSRARRMRLAGSVGAFVLALLSKETAVLLLPFLVVLDVYPLARFGEGPGRWTGPAARRVWMEKLPFLLLVLAEVPVVFFAHVGSGVPIALHSSNITVPVRVTAFSFTVVNFLWMTCVPTEVLPVHFIPAGTDFASGKYLLFPPLAAGITWAVFSARNRMPGLLAAWACHMVSFAPLLVLLGPTAELTAGRYTYLPCLGFALLAGAGLRRAWRWSDGQLRGTRLRAAVLVLAAAALTGLGRATWRQTGLWHDSITMWTSTLAASPDSYLAHFKLGQAYAESGDLDAARAHYEGSLRILPDQALAHAGLAAVLVKQGKSLRAELHHLRAVQLSPGNAPLLNDLGNAYFVQAKYDAAASSYRKALALDPGLVEARLNLGNTFAVQGKLEAAEGEYLELLRLAPEAPEAHHNLGTVLLNRGRTEEALARYREAVRLNPGYAEAYNNLCSTLLKLGRVDEALPYCVRSERPDAAAPQRGPNGPEAPSSAR